MIQRPCFGREQTLLKDGKYIKDLSYMNRPIKEIVYIDYEDEKVQFHKENAIVIPRFEGDIDDRALMDLVPFLLRKYFATFNHYLDLAKYPGDVRKEI